MGATVVEPANDSATTFGEKAANVVRHVAHTSHEARLLKSVAADAFEDGVYAAKRAFKRGSRELTDLRDEVEHQVKHEPFKSLGAAIGVGLFFGAVLGFFLGGKRRARRGART